jgi:hypothetical protein
MIQRAKEKHRTKKVPIPSTSPNKVKVDLLPSTPTALPSSIQVVDEKQTMLEYARILSDPTDIRSDAEIARELRCPVSLLLSWKSNPAFFQPVLHRFKNSFEVHLLDCVKSLKTMADNGGKDALGANRTILQVMGVLGGGSSGSLGSNDSTPSTGDTFSSRIPSMDDLTLDQEIHRLLLETTPTDVILSEGRVQKVEIADAISYDDFGRTGSDSRTTDGSGSDQYSTE